MNHTCVNTQTTVDGSVLPPCEACQAETAKRAMRAAELRVIEAAESFYVFCEISPRPGEYAVRKARLAKAVEYLRNTRRLYPRAAGGG